MEQEDETPPELQQLVMELRTRFEFVVTLKRHAVDSMDENAKQAFAFVLGGDSDNALVIEGGISGDGDDAHAIVWGIVDGEVTAPGQFELDGRVVLTLPLPTD